MDNTGEALFHKEGYQGVDFRQRGHLMEPCLSDLIDKFGVNVSHQEIARILDELEQTCEDVNFAAGEHAWIPVEIAQNIILTDLGYEDNDALEASINGPFEDFIKKIGHVEVKIQDDGSISDGQLVFRLKLKLQDNTERVPRQHVLKITSRDDLWRTCLKAKDSKIVVKELEFEIGADGKRHIDTIYNIMGNAVFKLSLHARQAADGLGEENRAKIMATVQDLEDLMDVKREWTLIIEDPTSDSEVYPADGVVILPLDE
eukprot:CFRG4150T1